MDDVASAHSENANLRKIQQKLLQWDNVDNGLASLSAQQLDIVDNLAQLCAVTTVKHTTHTLQIKPTYI